MVVRLINRPGFCKISGESGLTSLFTKPIHHKAPFTWRKLVPGRRVTRLPVALFLHFLTKLDEPLNKQKVSSAAKRLIPPPPPNQHPTTQPPTLPGHLLIGQLFLTLWLVHLGQLGQGKTIRAFAGAYCSSKGVNFFLTRTLAKVDNCIQIPSSLENLIWSSVRAPNCKLSERRKK